MLLKFPLPPQREREKALFFIVFTEMQHYKDASKPYFLKNCHSERSEESSVFKYLDPSLRLRMTEISGFEIGFRQLRRRRRPATRPRDSPLPAKKKSALL
jgi:hypothetical protein